MNTPAVGSVVKLYGYPDEYEVIHLGCCTDFEDWAYTGKFCPNGEAAITLNSLLRPYSSAMCFSVMQVTHIDGQSVANLISLDGGS